MALFDFLKEMYSKDSTLAGTSKNAEILGEKIGFASLGRDLFTGTLIGLAMIFLMGMRSAGIIFLLWNVINILIRSAIKAKKIKDLSSAKGGSQGVLYRNQMVLSAKYNVINSGVSLVLMSALAAGIIASDGDKLSELASQYLLNSSSDFFQSLMPVHILIGFLSFYAFHALAEAVKYYLIQTIKPSDDFAEIIRQEKVLKEKQSIAKSMPFMAAFLIIFLMAKVPAYILGTFMIFCIAIIMLSIKSVRKMEEVKLDKQEAKPRHEIQSFADEKILGSVFGILKTAAGIGDVFKVSSSSTLGAGKSSIPENTLLVTDKRLLFICVPVTGGDNVIGNVDFVMSNVFHNRSEIREKGEKLLKYSGMDKIISLAVDDVMFSDIKTAEVKESQIIITKNSSEKISYMFFDKEYKDYLRNLFSELLGSRLKA